MAEAIFNSLAKLPLQAKSAGSHPSGVISPEALATLRRHGLSDQGYRSKGVNEFNNYPIDVVITLCDDSVGESCPVFMGKTIKSHWGISDPTLFDGTREEIMSEFDRTFHDLKNRIELFLKLPFDQLDQEEVQKQLLKIGLIKYS
jgi:arsenate reductase